MQKMTLDDLIYMLENRSGMLVLNDSILDAHAVIRGFMLGKRSYTELDARELKFDQEFHRWVQDYYDCPIGVSWAQTILFYEGELKPALEKFVALYHEFQGDVMSLSV